MNCILLRSALLAAVCALTFAWLRPLLAVAPIARIVTAANTFMATLDSNQRHALLFAFNDEEQRSR